GRAVAGEARQYLVVMDAGVAEADHRLEHDVEPIRGRGAAKLRDAADGLGDQLAEAVRERADRQLSAAFDEVAQRIAERALGVGRAQAARRERDHLLLDAEAVPAGIDLLGEPLDGPAEIAGAAGGLQDGEPVGGEPAGARTVDRMRIEEVADLAEQV